MKLAGYVMADLIKEYREVKAEIDSIDAESRVRSLLTSVYDEHVYQRLMDGNLMRLYTK
jgi:hypothetical protein